jgi:hypothetical protein
MTRRTEACPGGLAAAPLLLLALLGACSDAAGDGGADAADEGSGVVYHRDVKPILDAHCVPCHQSGGVGPFALDTYAGAESRAAGIAFSTASRTMPPFGAAPTVRPVLNDISLSDAQIATLQDWVDQGAREGSPAEVGAPLDVDFGLLEDPNLTLSMAESFTPTVVPDHYRCFVLPWPYEGDRYVTGFNVRAGNVPIVHHAVLYLVDAENAHYVDDADGSDGAPGYACYGSASPDGVASFPTRQFGGWAPGSQGTTYAEGTGVKVSAGARVVLQMHYNVVGQAGPQADLSAIDFKVVDQVDKDGGYLPWLDYSWPSDEGAMSIPAGDSSVIHEYSDDPTTAVLASLFIPGVDFSRGMRLYSVYPHMHQIGRRITSSVVRADGTEVPLVHIDDWDFHWQRAYTFAEPVDVMPGDRLKVTCEFDNSALNQPVVDGERLEPRDMDFGEGSYDEMCVSAFYAAPIFDAPPPSACEEAGSVEAEEGRFSVTFDAGSNIRNSTSLDGELRGMIYGSVFRAEDVTLAGPKEGAASLASFSFEVDLREAADGPHLIDTALPAGDYQLLGFLDTDANATPGSPDPDLNDPVLIPGRAFKLSCAEQAITARFAILLPER